MTASESPGYRAAQNGAAFFRLPMTGYLRVSGQDRMTYFQRQTTNDIGKMAPGKAVTTVLTNPSARILDVLTLIDEGPDLETYGVITLPGYGTATARYLKSRIFFNDRVKLEDCSQQILQFELCGPQLEEKLAPFGLDQAPEPGETVQLSAGGANLRLVGMEPALSLGFRLLVPVESGQEMANRLAQAGFVELDPHEAEIFRIERGLPQAGAELTEDYTPLETRLRSTISDHKGCYTGQEVIARQITYDKVTQQLCGLQLEQPASPGIRIWAGGRAVGTVTSAAESPRFGPLALAVIKRPYHEPGSQVTLGGETGQAAAVVALPFGQGSDE